MMQICMTVRSIRPGSIHNEFCNAVSRLNRLFAMAMIALLYLTATALSAQTSSATPAKKDIQEIYLSYLTAEGFRPDLTESGNVRFKREGRNYVIGINEKDPNYFRLTLAFSSNDKSLVTRQKRLEAASVANAETKVAKVFLDNEGDLVLTIELFLNKPGEANANLSRMLSAIDTAYDKYLKKFRETE